MGNIKCNSCKFGQEEDEIQTISSSNPKQNKANEDIEHMREKYTEAALLEPEHFELTKIPHIEEKLEAIDTVKETIQVTIELGEDVYKNFNNKGLQNY